MLFIYGKQVLTSLEELVDPKHTALLLIDLQNDYIMDNDYSQKMGWEPSGFSHIVPPIRRILNAGRKHYVLVVFVQMTFSPNHLFESSAALHMHLLRSGHRPGDSVDDLPTRCIEGTWGWRIIDDLAPLSGEVIVQKNRSNAFLGTNLDLILRSNGIRSVIIAGVVTHGCVFSTANDATFFDYHPIILRDCIASHDRRLHDAALLIMGEKMDVTDSERLLEIWKADRSSPTGR